MSDLFQKVTSKRLEWINRTTWKKGQGAKARSSSPGNDQLLKITSEGG